MYIVTLIVDDEIVSTNLSYHPMAKTLRLAWELLGGIPQAECCIRRAGLLVGYLHTNFRGEMDEAEVYTHYAGRPYGCAVVTPLNPSGPIFRGVFAGAS